MLGWLAQKHLDTYLTPSSRHSAEMKLPHPPMPVVQFSLGHLDTTLLSTRALIGFQVFVAYMCWRATILPLWQQSRAIRAHAKGAARGSPESRARAVKEAPPELQDAWNRMRPEGDDREVFEPSEALAPDRMLPGAYNGRLDAAAPGLFTGIGIAGTFIGLIFAFGKIDPTRSESSIQPLIHGMEIAFWNSLVGVALALLWTYVSRSSRHSFEVACRDLVRIVEKSVGRKTAGDQVLAAFTALQTSLSADLAALQQRMGALQAATTNSSQELLEKLVPTLEQSFRSLVDMPFDRLDGAVTAYGTAVADAARQQAEVVGGLTAAAALLTETKVGLGEALAATTAHVREFEGALDRWRSHAEASEAIVTETKSAAESLTRTAESIRTVGERHGQLASALGGAVTELRTAGGSITAASAQFDAAADRLERAAGRIESLSTDAAEEAARAARAELQHAIAEMVGALQRFGSETASSYEASTGRVISSVDTRMSDLTDRLSAELTTLSARLPEAMEQLSDATREVRTHVTRAVRSLDEAVRQLDAGTRQSLQTQLGEYDKALAEAVDRFSGTLTMWDGKVADLATASAEMKAAMDIRKNQVADVHHTISLPVSPAPVRS